MDISKDLAAASATPLILSILSRGDSYGYEIIQQVKQLSGGKIEWADGMLYPILHRLEKNYFVESYSIRAENGRFRKYYKIRKAGLKELTRQRESWDMLHALVSEA